MKSEKKIHLSSETWQMDCVWIRKTLLDNSKFDVLTSNLTQIGEFFSFIVLELYWGVWYFSYIRMKYLDFCPIANPTQEESAFSISHGYIICIRHIYKDTF